MIETPRKSQIYDPMNSMYHLQQDQSINNRFIRLKGQEQFSMGETQEILDQLLEQNLEKQIEINSFIAWGLLLLSVVFVASVPCWLMSGKIQIFTKNGWRFLFITIFLLPFLFYQQRQAKNQNQKFKNLLTLQSIKPIFVSTLNFCIWFWCLVYACKFTSMNHALCLSGLKPFLLTILKIRRGQNFHTFEIAGCILCIIGIIMVCTDSITLPMIFDNQTRKYLKMQPWKRLVFGDTIAFFGTIVSVYLDQNKKVPGMPRFTHMFFYNICASFNMITFGYFFGGNTFDFHWKFGVFSLFTYDNFVYVLYPSIMLGLFVMILNILAAQIFNELMINIATCFKLIISSLIMHILGLELIMSGLTILGFCFIIPGIIFIISGQTVLQNKDNALIFEVYRTPDLFYNPMTNVHNISIQSAKPNIKITNQGSNKQIQQINILNASLKSLDRKDFEIILQEQEEDTKEIKIQKKKS